MKPFFLICAILSFLSGVVGSGEVEEHFPLKGGILFVIGVYIWVKYSTGILHSGAVFLGIIALLLIFVFSILFVLSVYR